MRFISIMTLNPASRLPTEAEMTSMHKFIVEGMKAGWLIECEGVTFGTTGVRVHKAASGEITVTDGPFAETKEVLGGYALLNAASKEEAVEHTRRFLDHVGHGTGEGTWEGTWETYQLFEMPGLLPKTWSSLNGNRTTGREPGGDPCENDPDRTRSRPSSATSKPTSTPA